MILIQLNKILKKEGFKTVLRKNYSSELININTIFMKNLQIDDDLVIHTKRKKIKLLDMMSDNIIVKENFLKTINSLPERDIFAVKKIIKLLDENFKKDIKDIIECGKK